MRNGNSNNWKGSQKEYYSERCVRLYLESKSIDFKQEARFGMFSADFYFPSIRLSLEVDGSQHWTDPKIAERDQRKEAFLLEEYGVRTIRVRAIDFVSLNKEEQINFFDIAILARMEER